MLIFTLLISGCDKASQTESKNLYAFIDANVNNNELSFNLSFEDKANLLKKGKIVSFITSADDPKELPVKIVKKGKNKYVGKVMLSKGKWIIHVLVNGDNLENWDFSQKITI